MASSQSQVDFLIEQLSKYQPNIRYKKMFGEYGLYQDEKFFGMICDNKLFLKSTDDLKKILFDDKTRPYEGAGMGYYHIPEAHIEDEKLLQSYLKASLNFVPKLKKKKLSV
jgi:TfoX/Sxy family transcriptional regulator of competence genes